MIQNFVSSQGSLMPFYGKRPPTTTVDLGEKKYNNNDLS